MRLRIVPLLLAAALLAWLNVPAQATVTSLTNGNFETDTVTGGEYTAAITSWYQSDLTNGYKEFLIKNTTIFNNSTNVLDFGGGQGYVYQAIGTYTAGEQLAVSGELLCRYMSGKTWTYPNVDIKLYATTATAGANGTAITSLAGATLLDSYTLSYSSLGLPSKGNSTGTASWSAKLTENVKSGVSAGETLWLMVTPTASVGTWNNIAMDNLSVAALPPANVTVLPTSGSLLHLGTLSVANASGCADGRVTSVFTQGLNGTWTLAGISAVSGGSTLVGTATLNSSGLLNGANVNASLAMTVATTGGTINGAASDSQTFNYSLTSTVSGNTGNGSAVVAAGASYAGLNSVGGSSISTSVTLLAGTNSSGSNQTISLTFDNPNSRVTPNVLASDIIDLTGTGTQTYVLEMSYDTTKLVNNDTYIAYWNGTAWVNAGSGSDLGAYAGQLTVGSWGVDTTAHTAWVVLNHNSDYAVVPEPSTLAMLAGALLGLIAYAWRKRK